MFLEFLEPNDRFGKNREGWDVLRVKLCVSTSTFVKNSSIGLLYASCHPIDFYISDRVPFPITHNLTADIAGYFVVLSNVTKFLAF
jgi:hypothetical protein